MATALERWRTAGLKEVTLPSGHKVRGVLPTVEALSVRGILPMELSSVALQFATSGVKLTDMATEEFTRFTQFARTMAAAFVRDIWNDETNQWEPVTLTATDFNEGFFDPGDIDALEGIALRQRSVSGEEPSPVAAWAEFPEVPASDDDRAGGGEVQPIPVAGLPTDNGPRRRSGTGRSHRAKNDHRGEPATGAIVPPG